MIENETPVGSLFGIALFVDDRVPYGFLQMRQRGLCACKHTLEAMMAEATKKYPLNFRTY